MTRLRWRDPARALTLLRDRGVSGTALQALAKLPEDTRRAITDMISRAASDQGSREGRPEVGEG